MNKKSQSGAIILVVLLGIAILAALFVFVYIQKSETRDVNSEQQTSGSIINNILKQSQYNIYCPFSEGLDTDEDGVLDDCDNCPTYYNPEQLDNDHDGNGNQCEHLFASRNGDDDEDDIPECQDTQDNDGDNLFDFPEDPECDSREDDSEGPFNFAQCSDTLDNDGDNLFDFPEDPGCSSRLDNTEDPFNYPQCSDTLDNDGDNLFDFPEDPGCSDSSDNTEFPFNYPQCSDTLDNDGDNLFDFPEDPECDSRLDNNEFF